jgi:hypothetical protein
MCLKVLFKSGFFNFKKNKTTLKTRIRSLVPKARPYQIIPCRNAVFSYNHIGTKTITVYEDTGYHCFDDLGVEPIGKHFGRECNVMGEILLSRYDLFIETKTKLMVPTTSTQNK